MGDVWGVETLLQTRNIVLPPSTLHPLPSTSPVPATPRLKGKKEQKSYRVYVSDLSARCPVHSDQPVALSPGAGGRPKADETVAARYPEAGEGDEGQLAVGERDQARFGAV